MPNTVKVVGRVVGYHNVYRKKAMDEKTPLRGRPSNEQKKLLLQEQYAVIQDTGPIKFMIPNTNGLLKGQQIMLEGEVVEIVKVGKEHCLRLHVYKE